MRVATRLLVVWGVLGALTSVPVDGAARTLGGGVARPPPARPTIEAAFAAESYRPGTTAVLVLRRPASTGRVLRAGGVSIRGLHRDEVRGTPVGEAFPLRLSRTAAHRWTATIRIGSWPSGVYFLEIGRPGRLGYAVFVLAPERVGEHRVAVVMPTNTWDAYNRRDDDANGLGDTWYEEKGRTTIDLTRPFLDRGVPPNFNAYDLPFLRWLDLHGEKVDVLSQQDLEKARGGDALARAYDLIVFPGHHEYVSAREYDLIERYRDLGGNLMFLSANNLFYSVRRTQTTMTRLSRWRDIGRPEASLVGAQFVQEGEQRGRYVLRRTPANRWIFAGTGLRAGSRFGNFGIEIDTTARSSPAGIQVLAEMPNVFGPGLTAQMTYYETGRGARVFAAGAFTMAGSALQGDVTQVLENLWSRLTLP